VNRTAQGVVLAFALIYAAVGIACVFAPVAALEPVGLAPASDLGRVEVYAMYGGLEFGMASFLAWTALDTSRVRIGLAACGLSIGGLGLGRLVGMLALGPPSGLMWGLCVIEIGGAIVAGTLWRKTTD
jgi:hypothetical protein